MKRSHKRYVMLARAALLIQTLWRIPSVLMASTRARMAQGAGRLWFRFRYAHWNCVIRGMAGTWDSVCQKIHSVHSGRDVHPASPTTSEAGMVAQCQSLPMSPAYAQRAVAAAVPTLGCEG